MPFGHIYVDAEPPRVVEAMDRFYAAAGFARIEMRPERHPRAMEEVRDTRMRLFWVSPRLGRWTGLFEFRYYRNDLSERWGLTDDRLAPWLSRELPAVVYRMEVIDNAGFWLWSRLERGVEAQGGAYESNPSDRSTDPSHPRYALNRIIEREGLRNVGVTYESIPGPQVRPILNLPQSPKGIEGLEGFVHVAYATDEPRPL